MSAAGGPGDWTSPTPNIAAYTQPAWSPDGKRLTCTQEFAKFKHVIVMNPDGSSAVPASALNGPPAVDPVWSPDGSRIAYTSLGPGTGEIHVMAPDGSGDARLSNPAAVVDHKPAWSPSGDRIVFVSNRSGSDQLWVMGADGSNPVLLLAGPGLSYDPTWS